MAMARSPSTPCSQGTTSTNYRPSHFHVKVWVDGIERLTTQLYFEGDPYFGVDSIWLPELIMPVQTLPGGGLEVQFEFVV